MSVTQDYKILTLTDGEAKAVAAALVAYVEVCRENWAFTASKENALRLADAQSALTKEMVVKKPETLTHNQICARAIAMAFNVEQIMVMSAAMAEYHNRYSTGAPSKREAAMVSAWDILHLAVQVVN